MYQLKKQEHRFDFLESSTINGHQDIGSLVGHFYETSYETQEFYSDTTPVTLVPTRYMLLLTAWNDFEWHYMQYILNGYGGDEGEDTRCRIEQGEDIEEIMMEWSIAKSDLASCNCYFTDENIEKQYFNEIMRALDVYHISYFDDTGHMGVFTSAEEVKPTKLINPYIKEVW
ncbi:hypothetical protein [Priestia megaterium]|uniref:hypothetical protein n=2 Tax=Priestia megaterium TaxID=1404 RepID=UPI002E243AB9|nr:hypothetical protein [Priestia megaterium]